MEHEQQHPRAHLFTLRLWQEELGGGESEWRGRVQDVTSGEAAFFRDWPGLAATVQRLAASACAARPDTPHEQ